MILGLFERGGWLVVEGNRFGLSRFRWGLVGAGWLGGWVALVAQCIIGYVISAFWGLNVGGFFLWACVCGCLAFVCGDDRLAAGWCIDGLEGLDCIDHLIVLGVHLPYVGVVFHLLVGDLLQPVGVFLSLTACLV